MSSITLYPLLRMLLWTAWPSRVLPANTHPSSPTQTEDQSNTIGTMRQWINVTLHPSYPPALPSHICDWIVTSVTVDGIPPNMISAEYTQWLEGLPARIETFSVMNNLEFQQIIKALIMVWMVGLWLRSRRFGAYLRDKSNMRLMFDIGVASLVCFLAMHKSLKRCILVIVCWATTLEEGPSCVVVPLAFGLAFSNCMVAAICITVAYNSTAVLVLMAPWEEDAQWVSHLHRFPRKPAPRGEIEERRARRGRRRRRMYRLPIIRRPSAPTPLLGNPHGLRPVP